MHGCPDVSARDTRSTLRKNENEENREYGETRRERGDRLLFSFSPCIPFFHRLFSVSRVLQMIYLLRVCGFVTCCLSDRKDFHGMNEITEKMVRITRS